MSEGKGSVSGTAAVAASTRASDAPLASTQGLTRHQRGQLRRLLLTAVAGCGLLGLAVLVSARLLIGQFASIERSDTEQKAAQIFHAAETDVRQLGGLNRNNAEWDDAVEFVSSHSQTFLDSNFNATTLGDLRLDLSAIVDEKNQLLFSALYERASRHLASPAPPELTAELLSIVSAQAAHPERLAMGEIVRTGRGLMELSSIEIKRSDRSGATGARMLAGRLLGPAEIARFADTSQLPVALVPLSDTVLPPGSIHASGASAFARPVDDTTIRGYAVLRDYTGTPVALLRTQVPRDVFRLGVRSTSWLLGGSALLLMAFGAAVIGLVLRLRKTLDQYDEAQFRLQRLASQLRDIVLLVRASDLRILDANDAAVKVLGASVGELTVRRLDDLFPDIIIDQLVHTLQEETSMRLESIPLMTPQRKRILTDSTLTWLDDTNREIICVVSSDVSHRERAEDLRKEKERQVARLAHYDSLTGLPNRHRLLALLGKTMRQVRASVRELNALYYLNLDDLRSVNESHGLACGDQVLRILARRLRAGLDAQYLLARVGGDEFAVVATMLPDMAAVEELGARIETLIEAPMQIDEATVAVSACAGIALFPDHGVNAETLLRHADMALHAAQHAGPRQMRVFSVELSIEAKGRADMARSLREALTRHEIRTDYEPVFDIETGRLAYLDCAPVWEEPEFGVLDRGALFEAVEKAHLLPEFGRELMRLVTSDLQRWKGQGRGPVPVILAIGPAQVDAALAEVATRQVAEAGVDAPLLMFSIAASSLTAQAEPLRHAIERLRSAGFAVLADCSGPALPPADYPLAGLRLAPALVAQFSGSASPPAALRRQLQEARRSGRCLIAQGVDAMEGLAAITEIGCTAAQGSYLGPVQTARQCESLLAVSGEAPAEGAIRSQG